MPDEFEIENGVLIKYRGHNKNVVIPDGVTEIGRGAFRACRIESVFIPEGVVSIRDLAFTNTGVERVPLPSTLKSIRKGAFLRCGELK